MSRFFERLSVVPWERAIAILAAVAGALGLFHVGGVGSDVLTLALPKGLVVATNVVYLGCGVFIFFGIGLAKRWLESFGLSMFIGSTVLRTLALFYAVGLTGPVLTGFTFNLVFLWSAVSRLVSVLRGDSIVRTRKSEVVVQVKP